MFEAIIIQDKYDRNLTGRNFALCSYKALWEGGFYRALDMSRDSFTELNFEPNGYLDSTGYTAIVPLVTVKDGKVFANSRDVAEYFGKLHKNVLRDIDNLDCSENFNQLNFEPVAYKDAKGETRRSIDMTKDGFTFLVMGFTGAEAGRFKEAYITAFNEMEAKLKSSTPALPNFADPAAAAIAWAEEYRAKEAAKREVEKLKPLAMVGSRAVAHNHSRQFGGMLLQIK